MRSVSKSKLVAYIEAFCCFILTIMASNNKVTLRERRQSEWLKIMFEFQTIRLSYWIGKFCSIACQKVHSTIEQTGHPIIKAKTTKKNIIMYMIEHRNWQGNAGWTTWLHGMSKHFLGSLRNSEKLVFLRCLIFWLPCSSKNSLFYPPWFMALYILQ